MAFLHQCHQDTKSKLVNNITLSIFQFTYMEVRIRCQIILIFGLYQSEPGAEVKRKLYRLSQHKISNLHMLPGLHNIEIME